MNTIFVDTNAWIALNSKRDHLHREAVATNHRLLEHGCRYLSTNFVLDETYTGLRMKIGHVAAVDFGEKLQQSQLVTIIHISPELETAAWQLFKQYADKDFSFTDCTSFVVMRQFGMTEAFTNDHHFAQMGFSVLLFGKKSEDEKRA